MGKALYLSSCDFYEENERQQTILLDVMYCLSQNSLSTQINYNAVEMFHNRMIFIKYMNVFLSMK